MMGRQKNVFDEKENCVMVHYGLLIRGIDRSRCEEEDNRGLPEPHRSGKARCDSSSCVYDRIEISL